DANAVADKWLELRPNNRLACLSKMLVSGRAGDIASAVDWARRAAKGEAYPHARELARGEAFVRHMQQTGKIGPQADLIRAALMEGQGLTKPATELVRQFLGSNPDSALKPLAESLLAGSESAPASRDSP